ncbi:MAG: VWA domain-containing protein [Opitutales bacterium]
MTFAEPIWLILTPVLLVLIAGLLAYGMRRRDKLLSRFAAARLLASLTQRAPRRRILLKAALLLLAVAGIGLALARPQYGVEITERKARGLDILFLVDTSKSMLASDLRPNRLKRAKLAVQELVDGLDGHRLGLITFAGEAFLQTPPTLDYGAFRKNLQALDTGSMTRGGSDLGRALREATEAFPSDYNKKVAVLLTDGEDLAQSATEAATELAENGVTVHTIGVGTSEGDFLRMQNNSGGNELVRDPDGEPVRSRLDESTLRAIAETTGGRYQHIENASLRRFQSEILGSLPREQNETTREERPIERFQWPLALALLFLVMEITLRNRRAQNTAAAAVLFLFLFAAPPPLPAQEDLAAPRNTPGDASGEDQETKERSKRSAARQDDPRILYNEAYEQLMAGEYETARDKFSRAVSKSNDLKLQGDALYNMGHAVNQLGEKAYESGEYESALEQWEEAKSLFKSAHEIDPRDKQAEEATRSIKERRQALERFLEEQEQQQQEDGEGSEDSGEEDGDSQQEGDQESGSEDGQQEGSDGQSETGGSESESGSEASQGGEDSGSAGEGQADDSGQESGDPDDSEAAGENGQRDAADPGQQGQQDAQDAQDEQGRQDEEDGAPESTADPAEDMAEPGAQESDDDGGEDPAQATAGEPADPGAEEEGSATAVPQAKEGFSKEEAEALLDSLRNSQRLLPFTQPSTQGSDQSGDRRDW